MMKFRIQIFLLLVILNVCDAKSQVESDSVTVLRPREFSSMLVQTTPHILIDARPVTGYDKIKLEGSHHAPSRSVLFPMVDSLSKDYPIFVYCGKGVKSTMVCNLLKRRGFTALYNMKGGIRSWNRKKFPVVKIEDGNKIDE